MTYCLGILLDKGLVLAADSRSNAGVDHVARVRKLAVFKQTDQRLITVLSAGNLATTQAVVANLRQNLNSPNKKVDLFAAATMFDVARLLGDRLRRVMSENEPYVKEYGDVGASFLVGGQIRGEAPRLFQIYPAGNFVEASPRTHFLQIGETKYGKPILDRALRSDLALAEAAKLTLLSFDATMRSNLSVAPPIDLLCYETDSFSDANRSKYRRNDPVLTELRTRYSEGLRAVVRDLPSPPLAHRSDADEPDAFEVAANGLNCTPTAGPAALRREPRCRTPGIKPLTCLSAPRGN